MYVLKHSENLSTITSCGTSESSEEILTQLSSSPKRMMGLMTELSKFRWVPGKDNSKPPIPSKATEGLILKSSLMSL